MTNKAQVFLADSMASIAVFSFFVLAFGLVWNVSVEDATNQDNFKQAKGEYTLNILKSEGNPQNWNTSTVQTPGVFEDGKLSRSKFLKLDKIPSSRLRDSLTSSQQFQIQAKYMNGTVLKEDGRNLTVRSTIRQHPDLNQDSLFSISTQNGFNKGYFDSTSADRDNNSGDLGIGYLNGTSSDQPNDVGLNNESLVGYWRLDQEVSGSNGVLKDYSGLGNDGITKNGVSTGEEGVFSTDGIQLDGSDDYLNVPDESIVEGKNKLTISAWVYTNGRGTGYPGIVVAQNGANQVGIFQHDERFYYEIGTDDNNQNRIVSGEPADLGKWTHVSLVFNGSSKTMKEYINGRPTGRTETTSTSTTDTDYKNLNIGRWQGGPETFNGSIDEVRIYNSALSPNDIRDLYFNGRNGEFNGSYRSEIFTRSQETDWSALEVNASVPSDTDLTATFESLEQGPLQTAQSYASPSEWNLGSFNTTTADNVVVEKQNVSMLEASKPSEFNQGEFNKTTSDEVVTEYKYPSELEASTQSEFNQGSFNGTSADRNDNSGDLGLGYRNGSSSDNLVGYWPLDRDVNGDEGTVKDYSGKSNSGTTNGGVTTGEKGIFSTDAYDFDGVDDSVVVKKPFPVFNNQDFTLSAWVNVDDFSNDRHILGGEEPPGQQNADIWWKLQYDVGVNKFGIQFDDGASKTTTRVSTTPSTNTWYHLVVTHTEGVGYEVYLNGIPEGTGPETDATLEGNHYFYIGDDVHGGSSSNMDGTIDEVRIYNRSLPQDEVEDLYLKGKDGKFKGNYTAEKIDNSQDTNWNKLEVNASIPSDTSVNATFKALDTNGNLVDSQLIDLSEGLSNYSLSVSNSEDAEVFINGTSSNVTKSWEVHGLEVFSREIADKNKGLRIGYQNGSAGDNLVGYWRLDRNVSGSGGTVKDYSGNRNDGVTNGGLNSNAEGILGAQAFQFDGSDDYVSFSDDENLGPEKLTISLWAYRDGSKHSVYLFDGRNHHYFIKFDDGTSTPRFGVDTGSYNMINSNFGDIPDQEWTHIVGSYNGSVQRLYINGVLAGENSISGDVQTSSGPARIGDYIGGGYEHTGKIDEIRLYNRSLSSSEVKNLYFKGRPFQGNYTAEKIDNSQETNWDSLEVNASVSSNTSVNATFRALDTDGGLVAEQDVDLGQGLNNYSLSVASSEDAEVFIDGTSSNVTKTWEVHSLEVYSNEVVDRNDGLRIGYRNGSVGDNLVGYYRLDRNVSGSSGAVKDYSGENNGGATKGGVSAGADGTFSTDAMDFDGNDDYVEIDSSSSNLESWTVSGWIKLDDWSDSARKEWLSVSEDETTSKPLDFVHESGDIKHYRGNAAGEVMSHDVSAEQGWHHMVVTQTRTSDSNVDLAMYFDGSEVDTDSGDYENMRPSLDFSVGRIAGSNPDRFYWTGQVDEIRIYDESLAQSEIDDLYFNGRNGEFNGSYTAEKIDKAQETIWNKLEVNASVPSQTSVDARFNVLDSQGGLVDSQIISLDDGRRNYSLDVEASKNARLNFNGTSSNVTKTWKIQNFEVYSSEYQVKQSQNLNVLEGSNEYLLGVGQSKAARVGFKGSSTDVKETWSIESFSVLNTSSYGSAQPDLNLSKQESYNQGEFNGTSTDRSNNSGTLGIGYLNGTKSGQTNDNGLNNESLVGYWRLDRSVSGTDGDVIDYSGERNNGTTINGVTDVSKGVMSTEAMELDGSDDYIAIDRNTALDVSTGFSMMAWIRTTDSTPGSIIRTNYSDASFPGAGENDIITLNSDWSSLDQSLADKGAIGLKDSSGDWNSAGGTTDVNDGSWHLLVGAFNGSNLRIYVDGNLEGASSSFTPVNPDSIAWRIGSFQNVGTEMFDGIVDEVRLYNRPLSQPEVEDLYFNGRNGEFKGGYTAERIDKNQETSWNNLEVDASVPSQTSVNVTFESLDSSNNVIGSQEIVIKDGLKNYSLQTGVSENAEVSVQGTSSDVTKTWEIRDIQVFGASKKSEERVSQIPENKSVRTFRSLALDAKTDKRVQLSFYRWSS